MKINFNNDELNSLLKFQEGGEMPAETAPVEKAPAAPEQGGGDPMEQLVQAAAQAVQTQDAQLALQVCQAIVEMAGGGAPAPEQAPEGAAPVYKKGGKFVKWVRK